MHLLILRKHSRRTIWQTPAADSLLGKFFKTHAMATFDFRNMVRSLFCIIKKMFRKSSQNIQGNLRSQVRSQTCSIQTLLIQGQQILLECEMNKVTSKPNKYCIFNPSFALGDERGAVVIQFLYRFTIPLAFGLLVQFGHFDVKMVPSKLTKQTFYQSCYQIFFRITLTYLPGISNL